MAGAHHRRSAASEADARAPWPYMGPGEHEEMAGGSPPLVVMSTRERAPRLWPRRWRWRRKHAVISLAYNQGEPE